MSLNNREIARNIVSMLSKKVPPMWPSEEYKQQVFKEWIDSVEKILDDSQESNTKETFWKCYFDGSASPNPGPMSYGYVITDQDGNIVKKQRNDLGPGTNNQAEYHGLIALCIDLLGDPRFVLDKCYIYGDSKLVVNQVNGEWKVNTPKLKPMCEQARSLIRGLNCKLGWVPRMTNTIADQLSKRSK